MSVTPLKSIKPIKSNECNEQNIIKALEYLMMEAEREECHKLHKILEIAYRKASGEQGEIKYPEIRVANDDDWSMIVQLLLKFFVSSPVSKREFLAHAEHFANIND